MASSYNTPYSASTSQHGSSYYAQGYHQPSSNRLELPRSISTTNLEMTKQCQDYVRKDLCSTFPDGGTCFFMDLPGYTFTIPHLAEYPPDFRQFVFDRIVDQTVKRSLEEENCLNWFSQATKLEPLNTKGDGNCLLHAASLGMWGFQDRDHILRNAVSQAVQHATQGKNTFYMRWKCNKEWECREQGFQLEPGQWRQEWETVVRQASSAPTATATLHSLEEFHVFVLANVLRRPVIMYASQKMRSFNSGGTMQTINFHGVYLPLLWAPNGCKKDPLPLSYQGGHFSALVVVDSSQQYRDGKLVLPLVDCSGCRLPVRFMLQGEYQNELLNDYLSLIDIPDSHTQQMVPCATMSVNTKPVYHDRLVGAFIDACHTAYLARQQQLLQQPYSQGGNYSGYSGGSGMDGRYATTTTTPIEASYSTAAKQQTNIPQVGEQGGKIKCINNCGMFGDPETAGLCSRCHKRTLAAALQQESPTSQAHSQSTTDSGATGMSGPTSIKCPTCSQPGHPKYLGMCENCYHSSQNQPAQPAQPQYGSHTQPQYGNQPQTQTQYGNQTQPQYGNQPQTQPQYGNQTQTQYGNQPQTQPQYGNQTQTQYGNQPQAQPQYGNQTQTQYGNQPAQPQYGNQTQPLYGNEHGVQPQYGNQGHPLKDNVYESLDHYHKPDIPPRQEALSPPPVPLPRSTASPEERNKCRTPDCEFFGTAETRFYCSKCFNENMDAIFKETDKSVPVVPTAALAEHLPYQPQTSPYHATQYSPSSQTSPYHGQHTVSPVPHEQGKCTWCQEYYGAPEYGGLCHGCYKKTKDTDSSPGKKCPSCNDFFGSEEYGGLCNACFLKRTEQEIHVGSQGFPPAYHPPTQGTFSSSDLPAPEFNFDPQPPLPPKPGYQPSHPQHLGSQSQAAVPYSQPGYRPMTEPQPGTLTPAQGTTRPVPKPRSRAATTTTFAQNTAPVATASDMTNAMARMNISQSRMTVNCFMCTGTVPDTSVPSTLCPQHAELVTKRVGLVSSSQASTSGGNLQEQHLHPNVGQLSARPDMLPNSSSQHWATQSQSYGPIASSASTARPQPYEMQHIHPQPTSHFPHAGGTGGNMPHLQSTSQYDTEVVKSKPQASPQHGLGTMYSSQGGQFSQPPPSHYSATSGPTVSTGNKGGGPMLNNLNTNTSGSGVLAANNQPEELGTVGLGLQSGQSQGATGGAMPFIGGGGAAGIQPGVSSGAAGETTPKVKVLCKTAGCSFYADPKLENLCINCYEEYYEEKAKE